MKKNFNKILVMAFIIIAAVAFRFFSLDDYLFSYIKESQQKFEALYADHTLPVIGGYMLVYILATSLSLPVAAIMSLAGGALFGLLRGTVIVSFASTIGAALACFVSRFVLRDWVQGKFGDRLKTVNAGIDREGPFYLFTLRLIPVFPFWLINLLMGLTKMPLRTFYWVSLVGMIPGTIVYVNAGRELGKLDSLSGILSPGLILSFTLLGLFPLITKKTMAIYTSKRKKTKI
jgi:uncharacterized membrane protein YdjX (TVP38/TMEM64 family)